VAKLANHNLKKQLRQFSKIQPSSTWLAARRSLLMNQIESQVAERETGGLVNRIRLFIWGAEAAITGAFNGIAARGAAMAVLFLALSLGASGYVLAAAENSVPGDSLYQVKLAVEDARLSMARSQKARVALEVEFASRRLEEVKTLAESRDQGTTHASVLVAQFQNDLSKFSATTNELSQTSPESGAEVAKLLEGKLEDYKFTLSSTIASDPNLKKELNRAISSISRTQTQALKVIVEDNESPDQAVVDKIADKIRLAEESLRASDAKLADDTLFEGGGTKTVREQSAIAKVNLVEARQKVDEGDYRAAVGIIDQIEDLVFDVEEAVDEATDDKVEGATDGSSSNKTEETTSNIIE
jgi:hypothetical protein